MVGFVKELIKNLFKMPESGVQGDVKVDQRVAMPVEALQYSNTSKPVQSIPAKITEINGITNADVRHAPGIKEALGKLLQFIGDDVLVAHNASFDMKFLLANMYKQQFAYKRFKAIDTVALAREYMDTPNHKLPTLKEFLGLGHFNSHEALHDCYVAGEVYRYCYGEKMVVK